MCFNLSIGKFPSSKFLFLYFTLKLWATNTVNSIGTRASHCLFQRQDNLTYELVLNTRRIGDDKLTFMYRSMCNTTENSNKHALSAGFGYCTFFRSDRFSSPTTMSSHEVTQRSSFYYMPDTAYQIRVYRRYPVTRPGYLPDVLPPIFSEPGSLPSGTRQWAIKEFSILLDARPLNFPEIDTLTGK